MRFGAFLLLLSTAALSSFPCASPTDKKHGQRAGTFPPSTARLVQAADFVHETDGQPVLISQQKQAPTVRVITRLVQVNVVVQDRKGQAITDMTRDDFEVTEQGRPQTISAFSVESNQQAVGLAEALPANTFSNLPSRAGATQNLTVILLDTLNTPITDQVKAKKEVLQFLNQMRPGDRVAIYGLGSVLRVIHDFTGDGEALARAVMRYANLLSSAQQASTAEFVDNTKLAENDKEAKIIEAMDSFLSESSLRIAARNIEYRTDLTLRALEAVANHLAFLPGRKSVIWVSAGFPFSYGSEAILIARTIDNAKNSADIISRTAKSLTSANVAIYPVDARGVISAVASSPSTHVAAATTTARQAARLDTQASDETLASHDTMQELADQTGGRASYNANDINVAIRRALDDSRFTYTLGYYPSDPAFDGKFRPIKVSVKRPGVQLRYRRGYYAYPEEPLDEAQRERTLYAAATAPLDMTRIGFSVELGEPAPGSSARRLVLEVDTDSVKIEKLQDHWAGGLDIQFAQFDVQGNLVNRASRQVPLRLTAADLDQLKQFGLVLNINIDLRKNCDRVRVILRDTKTGAIGTVTIPIH
jgi:VWFA-related protein